MLSPLTLKDLSTRNWCWHKFAVARVSLARRRHRNNIFSQTRVDVQTAPCIIFLGGILLIGTIFNYSVFIDVVVDDMNYYYLTVSYIRKHAVVLDWTVLR